MQVELFGLFLCEAINSHPYVTHIVIQFLITSPITRAPMLKCAVIVGLVEREMYTAMKLHLTQKCGVRNLNRP